MMSFGRFDEMDDMFGRMDRMMNSMMNNMFGSDPFGSPFNMISPFNPALSSALTPALNPMARFVDSRSLFPSHSMSFSHNLMPESSYYCSSSVMSTSIGADGRPQIYESSHSTRSGPGGMRETSSSVRDSRTGLQKMSIGHHIEDRGHVMERSRNHYTGEEEQNNEYINIEEEEAPEFNREFRQRMSSYNDAHHRRRHLAVTGHRGDGRQELLALPAPHPPHVSPEPSSHSSEKTNRNNKMSSKKRSDHKKNKKPYKKV